MIYTSYLLRADASCFARLFTSLNRTNYQTRMADGCLQTGIWHNSQGTEIVMSSIWKTQEDFASFIKSNFYRDILDAFEYCNEEPDIRIIEFDRSLGMEWIMEVRRPEENVN